MEKPKLKRLELKSELVEVRVRGEQGPGPTGPCRYVEKFEFYPQCEGKS